MATKSVKSSCATTKPVTSQHTQPQYMEATPSASNLSPQPARRSLITTNNIPSGGTGELDFDNRFAAKVQAPGRMPNQQPHTAQQQSSFQLTFSKQKQGQQ